MEFIILPNAAFGGQTSPCVQRTRDGAFVPKDPNNADYQEYLAWVEKQTEEEDIAK